MASASAGVAEYPRYFLTIGEPGAEKRVELSIKPQPDAYLCLASTPLREDTCVITKEDHLYKLSALKSGDSCVEMSIPFKITVLPDALATRELLVYKNRDFTNKAHPVQISEHEEALEDELERPEGIDEEMIEGEQHMAYQDDLFIDAEEQEESIGEEAHEDGLIGDEAGEADPIADHVEFIGDEEEDEDDDEDLIGDEAGEEHIGSEAEEDPIGDEANEDIGDEAGEDHVGDEAGEDYIGEEEGEDFIGDEAADEYEEGPGRFRYLIACAEQNGSISVVKFSHVPYDETDQFALRFHSFKIHVPWGDEAARVFRHEKSIYSLALQNRLMHAAFCAASHIGDLVGEHLEESVETELIGKSAIGRAMKKVSSKFSKAGRSIKKGAGRARKSVGKVGSRARSAVKRAGSSVRKRLPSGRVFSRAKSAIKGAPSRLRSKASGAASKVRTSVANKTRPMRRKVTGAASSARAKVSGAATKVRTKVADKTRPMRQKVFGKPGDRSRISAIKSSVRGRIDKIRGKKVTSKAAPPSGGNSAASKYPGGRSAGSPGEVSAQSTAPRGDGTGNAPLKKGRTRATEGSKKQTASQENAPNKGLARQAGESRAAHRERVAKSTPQREGESNADYGNRLESTARKGRREGRTPEQKDARSKRRQAQKASATQKPLTPTGQGSGGGTTVTSTNTNTNNGTSSSTSSGGGSVTNTNTNTTNNGQSTSSSSTTYQRPTGPPPMRAGEKVADYQKRVYGDRKASAGTKTPGTPKQQRPSGALPNTPQSKTAAQGSSQASGSGDAGKPPIKRHDETSESFNKRVANYKAKAAGQTDSSKKPQGPKRHEQGAGTTPAQKPARQGDLNPTYANWKPPAQPYQGSDGNVGTTNSAFQGGPGPKAPAAPADQKPFGMPPPQAQSTSFTQNNTNTNPAPSAGPAPSSAPEPSAPSAKPAKEPKQSFASRLRDKVQNSAPSQRQSAGDDGGGGGGGGGGGSSGGGGGGGGGGMFGANQQPTDFKAEGRQQGGSWNQQQGQGGDNSRLQDRDSDASSQGQDQQLQGQGRQQQQGGLGGNNVNVFYAPPPGVLGQQFAPGSIPPGTVMTRNGLMGIGPNGQLYPLSQEEISRLQAQQGGVPQPQPGAPDQGQLPPVTTTTAPQRQVPQQPLRGGVDAKQFSAPTLRLADDDEVAGTTSIGDLMSEEDRFTKEGVTVKALLLLCEMNFNIKPSKLQAEKLKRRISGIAPPFTMIKVTTVYTEWLANEVGLHARHN